MNVNEYGVYYYCGTGFDMSAWTALSITFTKPDGTTLTVANPDVSIANAPVTTEDGIFAANTYGIYRFKVGDVNLAGQWEARLTYTDAVQRLINDASYFTIGP